MSKTLEKTFGGLFNSLIGSGLNLGTSDGCGSSSSNHASLGLISFVEKLEAARKISKQEEEDVIEDNFQEWKRLASLQNSKNEVISDSLCRSLIAFSRGHYFANLQIHAIKLMQSDKLLLKKIGYLYITRTMLPGSDLTVLLVNTVQRDLSSSNVIQISFGLCLLPIIVPSADSSLICNSIAMCLCHQQPYIRRRAAIMASSLLSSPLNTENFMSSVAPNLLRLLTDAEPSVAIAAIVTLSSAFKNSRDFVKTEELREEIAKASAHILLQATHGSLSPHYDCGPIHAPFVQVQMLRAIRNLSWRHWNVPEEVFTGVESVLLQPWGGRNLSLYMTFIEGITTVTSLPKNEALISVTLKMTLGFLKSSLIDFKYLGIKALANVFANLQDLLTEAHLEAVLECLESSSQLLQSRTIRLLCTMANESNYQAICVTLMNFAANTEVISTKEFVYDHLSEFLKRIRVNIPWFVAFLSPLLEGSDVNNNFLHTIQHIIPKELKNGGSKEETEAVILYVNKLLDILLKGESKSLEKMRTVAFILNILFFENPESIKRETVEGFITKMELKGPCTDDCVVDCLLYCGIFMPEFSKRVEKTLKRYSCDHNNLSVRLKSMENILLLRDSEICKDIFIRKKNIAEGKTRPDLTFTFCDDYVIEGLSKGAHPYKPFTLKRNYVKFSSFGSFNPFDMVETSSNFYNTEKDSISTSESLQSSLYGGSTVTGTSPNTPSIWTSKGRVKTKTGSENESLNSTGSGCVEIAHEAEETMLVEDGDSNPLPHSFSGEQKKDLAQMLLKGLGLSKH